jgi:glycosyltransferase involved in cell wall biosynthesis
MTKISVALCTYNGEKFLKQQLDSILDQTVNVNEIIICDDCSTDNTQNILFDYLKQYPDIFKIYINDENLRSVKNFEKAISLCTGDIIFLSDQDDVWDRTKVEVFKINFEKKTEINAICSNGFIITDTGEKLNKLTIWSVPNLLKNKNISFDYFNIIAFIENIATGAGMAFRSKIRPDILPIPVREGFHHDEWIALITSQQNSFMMIDEKLFSYRLHFNQQVGGVTYPNDESTKNRLINHFNIFSEEKTFLQYKKILKRLSQSYYKHTTIAAEGNHKNTTISKEIALRCKELFSINQANVKKRFPFKYFFLTIADSFNNKRKIE